MYKMKDRRSGFLFDEFLPFNGKLDEQNRWLKIGGLIPWEELEELYASYFSRVGRPGLDGRLVIGLFLLKHMTGLSDEELVQGLSENVYWQAFCGFEVFRPGYALDPSSLTKLRERLGVKYFRELENRTYKVLIDLKIIKSKGIFCDGTVFNENIKYPNDISLLNDVREWLVEKIKKYGKVIKKGYRTYKLVARKVYMDFAKKKKRTKEEIRRCKKQMIQFVRRNIKQIDEIVVAMRKGGILIEQEVTERLQVVKELFVQQYKMYKYRLLRINDRIVSFHKPFVRPIKRGKNGKDVEFGPKGALSLVDGFLFLGKLAHDNFSESSVEVVKDQVSGYVGLFGELPPWFVGDRAYGNREVRKYLEDVGIRAALRPLGRKSQEDGGKDQWLKGKQRERNRIEGGFGTVKEHYGLSRIRYSLPGGSEMWVRGCILGMNLKRALKRI